jgi:MtaA/CmuA family methyltransferase
MTPLERVTTVINGGVPDKVPVALHNFLLASRMAGIPMSQAFRDGNLLAEAQLVAWRRFKHDMLMVENGTTAMAQAMGCEVAYADDHPPYVTKPVVQNWSDIDKLTIPDPEKTFPLKCLLDATKILKKEIGGGAFVQARSDQAPLALASALRGYQQFFMDLADEENYVNIRRLADICRQATERFSLALQNAGADGTCIGELGPATISPRLYHLLAMPDVRKYFGVMRNARFPSALHQCGDTLSVIDDMVGSRAHILELDPVTDMAKAKAAARGKVAILGMVDPANVMHRGTPALVEQKCKQAIEVVGIGGGFLLGPGCALSEETPLENVDAMMAASDKYGVYHPDGSLKRP